MTVRRRLLAGLTASAYARAIGMLGQVALVPVLLYAWGAKGYGEWLSLTALASYISYSSIGLTPTVRADMTSAYSRNDRAAMRETYNTTMLTVVAVFGIALLLLAFLMHSVNIFGILHVSTIDRRSSEILMWMLCLQISLNVINGMVLSALSSLGNYGQAQFIDSTRQLFEFITIIIAVIVFKAGFLGAAIVYPILAVLGLAISWGILYKTAPWLGILPTEFSITIYRRLWRPMIGAFLLSFGYMGLVIQAPRLILAAAVGPAAVALFSVTTTLMRLARIGGELIAMPTAMEFAFAYGKGDLPLAQRLLQRSTSFSVWLMLLAAVPIVIFGPTFIHYWTAGKVNVPVLDITAAMLGTIAYSLGVSSMLALQAVNRILGATTAFIALSIPCLGLGYVTSKIVGPAGMLASVALLELGLAIAVIRVASRLVGVTPMEALATLRRPPIQFASSELRAFAARLRNRLIRT